MTQAATEATPFGGVWTHQKLECLAKYLEAYTRIFTNNQKARYFTTYYVDAFAGTGYVKTRKKQNAIRSLFDPQTSKERQAYLEGSALRALQVSPRFCKYLFIERDPERCLELEALRGRFPEKAGDIKVENAEANAFLPTWFEETDWSKTRAVLFLDPFATQVNWALIEQIAKTQAIDLWLLFPYMAFNRLLTRSGRPRPSWAKKLTDICGTDKWQTEFYKTRLESTLFGEEEITEKETDIEGIGRFILQRLRDAKFARVSPRPLVLRSSHGPLFLLCFAAGNQKGGPIAVRIADSIIGSKSGG